MAYAHYFNKTRSKPAEVIITVAPSLTSGTLFQSYVSGRNEARKHMRAYNAQPWNF